MATDTDKYKLNHTMIRVKDPQRSILFYEFLGFQLINKISQPAASFDLYFLAYTTPFSPKFWTGRRGVLELTHNYGTERDSTYRVVNGNEDPYKGFGHICISVDNIQAACKRISDAGYKFHQKLHQGDERDVAYALDPDGYWVKVISQKDAHKTRDITTTDIQTYRFNHSMLRVKNPEASLNFYQQDLGMTLLRTVEKGDHTLYYLGYPAGKTIHQEAHSTVDPLATWEGLLELDHTHGAENDKKLQYHNGNSSPQGFGHICVSVDDLDAACKRLEDVKVNWKKRLTDGRMKNVAFVLDPDGYWIEIIQNDDFKASSL